jgi:hypothetical protein
MTLEHDPIFFEMQNQSQVDELCESERKNEIKGGTI